MTDIMSLACFLQKERRLWDRWKNPYPWTVYLKIENMMRLYRKMSGFREKYVDTLAKLYDYSTTFYEKRPMSEMLGTDLKYT